MLDFNFSYPASGLPPGPTGNVEFGANTAAGEGGLAMPAGASGIADAGGTGLVESGGIVSPSASSVSTGTVTFTGTADTWDVVAVPNARSVQTGAQLESAVQGVVAYGDSILVRGPVHNTAGTGAWNRGSAPTGTWSRSNPVTVRGHAGELAVINYMELGSGNFVGFKFGKDLEFRTQRMGSESSAVRLGAGISNLTFEECRFYYGSVISPRVISDLLAGLNAVPSDQDGLWVDNCYFDGCMQAIGPTLQGDNMRIINNEMRRTGDDSVQVQDGNGFDFSYNYITDKTIAYSSGDIVDIRQAGSDVIIETDVSLPGGQEACLFTDAGGINASMQHRTFWKDGSATGHFSNSTTNQDITAPGANGSVRLLNETLAGTYTTGGVLWITNRHPDGLQLYQPSARRDDYKILGNIWTVGAGAVGYNELYDCVRVDQGPASNVCNNWEIKGNLIENVGFAGMTINNLQNSQVWSNVVVRRRDYPQFNGVTAAWFRPQGPSSTTVYDNITNTAGYGSTTQLNNGLVSVNAAYDTWFADAPAPGGWEWLQPTDNTHYAPEPGLSGNNALRGLAGWDFINKQYIGTR